MGCVRRGAAVCLALTLWALAASAADAPGPPPASVLYAGPVLVIDPGLHTARINRADADAAGSWAVTGSRDRTVRVWSLADGALVRTIRLPAGPGYVGQAQGVAISPDASLIAAGGLTGVRGNNPLYLLDRESGALVKRIDGLPSSVAHLTFAPDGKRLAAALLSGGIRVYDRSINWAEVARDEDYKGASYGASFAPDGRLATSSEDGSVRLYAPGISGSVHPTITTRALTGNDPFQIAFSPPDGRLLALGYADISAITLLDGGTLRELPRPDVDGLELMRLFAVAWSRDGQTLFAGGSDLSPRVSPKASPVVAFGDAGLGKRRILTAGTDSVMSIAPLRGGDILVATQEPWLGVLRPDGTPLWPPHTPAKADFRDERDKLAISADGTVVDFSFEQSGRSPARFDLGTLSLTLEPAPSPRVIVPRHDGLPAENWSGTYRPTLAGRPLALEQYERARSLAIAPAGDRFVLGTEWSLRAFDSSGKPLWTRSAPDAVWAVNITGDGRLVVAACGDGTIRWHRMSDGVELLAFMPMANRADWIAWTPEGFYAATPGAHGVLRWQVNHGFDAMPETVPVEDIPGSFRPEVLPLVLQELETPRALGLAELVKHNKEVALRTHSQLPPGAQLHLLAIGISAYNEDYAKNLRLKYADRDARDLASAIANTQSGLYGHVDLQLLPNNDADRAGILRGLSTLRTQMERGSGNDLAVVHFSGHGAIVGRTLYLLPYDVDARDAVGIENKGLSVDMLKEKLLELAKHGRVLVLLDACHSGAIALDGSAKQMDSTALREQLTAPNITVLTSSDGNHPSYEDDAWQHGAFTKAILDALGDQSADPDHIGLIKPTALAHYVHDHVVSLTGGMKDRAQTPEIEVRFDTTVFAMGL